MIKYFQETRHYVRQVVAVMGNLLVGNDKNGGEPVFPHSRLHVPETEATPLEEKFLLHERVGLLPRGGISGRERGLLQDQDDVQQHHLAYLVVVVQNLLDVGKKRVDSWCTADLSILRLLNICSRLVACEFVVLFQPIKSLDLPYVAWW